MDLTILIYGLNLAAIYALMAIGISILWSSVGMINMAHGATFAVSGYTAWLVSGALKPTIAALLAGTGLAKLATGLAALAAGVVAGGLFGVLIYLVAFLPIYDKPNFAVRSLIATLAINLATVQTLLYVFGSRQRGLPKLFGFGRFELFGVKIRHDQLGTIIVTILLLSVLLWWLRYSRKGLEIRAMMQNPEGAVLCGISVRWTALPVMILTGALAGLAAVLLSQTIFVSPTSGAIPLIKGLTIALLGGLGSVPGAVAGALVIGFLEAIVGAIPFLGQRYVLITQFMFIMAFLIVRPRGIGGLLDETRE